MLVFFFKQKTAYEMRISDWSSDVCSSDLLAVSVKRVLVGYAIGIAVGVSLGAVLGWWKGIAEAIVPLIETLRPIPPIAWVPIAILWFGIGDLPAYFIVFLGAVFPIFINTFTGIPAVDPSHVYSAQCLGASRWMMITRVLIPRSAERRVGKGWFM